MLRTSLRMSTALVNSVFLNGKKVSGVSVMLAYKKEGLVPRFSFSVSKKIAPTSVLRHRLRRVGYAVVETIQKTHTINPGLYCFVFKVRKNITQKSLILDIESVLVKSDSLSKKTNII
jgi:RNase P protein component